MSANALEVANIALTAIGTRTISNLSDPSKEARTINANFAACRRAVLRDHPWNFAKKRAVLTTVTSVPPEFGYPYAFVLPDDFLRVIRIFESSTGTDLPSDKWQVEGKAILTYSTQLNLKYVFDCENEELFDALFSECLALYIAWKCCYLLTGSNSRNADLWNAYQDALKRAKFTNATENPSPELDDDEWIRARDGLNRGFVRDPMT